MLSHVLIATSPVLVLSALALLAAAVLVVAAISIARTPISAGNLRGHSALWVLPTREEPDSVRIGVLSSELEKTSFRLVVYAEGRVVFERPFTLSTGERWSDVVDVSAIPEAQRSLDVRLIRNDQPGIFYREARLVLPGSQVEPTTGQADDTRPSAPPVAARRSGGRYSSRVGKQWGIAPYFALFAAAASLGVAVADALHRSGRGGGVALFWFAVLGLVAVAALRLALPMSPRLERIGIVVVTGEFLYLVKVFKDPFRFMNSDEPVHAYNAQQALDTGSLLHANPLLPVTAHYVGLPATTDAAASLSGLHVFGTGLVVIGIARLVMMLALFLLFEDVTGSARLGGLASLFYAAHPNFIFFTGQFAYESLAIPFAVLAVAGVNRWMYVEGTRGRRGWGIAALVAISAVVMTHHMTMYVLVGFLILMSLTHAVFARRSIVPSPWPFALFGFLAAVVWLIFVASDTAGYLTGIFGRAFEETIRTVQLESAPRKLFATERAGASPWGERVVGLSSVALIAVVLPLSFLEVWRRYRRQTVAVVLGVGAAAYLGVVFLRFVPRAWEIGNRASEFLFVGVALMFALASFRALTALPRGVGRAVVAATAVLLLAGGITAGSPSDLRFSLPYRVDIGDHILVPQGTTAAGWVRANLGKGRNFIADPSNARLDLSQGETAYTGENPNLNDVLRRPLLAPWMVGVIRRLDAEFIVVDRRQISQTQTFGNYFFSTRAARLGLYSAAQYSKFARQPGISKVFDSGNISIYDLDQWRYDPSID